MMPTGKPPFTGGEPSVGLVRQQEGWVKRSDRLASTTGVPCSDLPSGRTALLPEVAPSQLSRENILRYR